MRPDLRKRQDLGRVGRTTRNFLSSSLAWRSLGRSVPPVPCIDDRRCGATNDGPYGPTTDRYIHLIPNMPSHPHTRTSPTNPKGAPAVSLPTLTGTARLLTDPKRALTKDRKPMATALLKFQGWRKVDGKWVEGDHVVASAIAFEDVARDLAQHGKGDEIEVAGVATLTVWNEQPRLNLSLKAVAAVEKRQRNPEAVAA